MGTFFLTRIFLINNPFRNLHFDSKNRFINNPFRNLHFRRKPLQFFMI
ncbi:hypothetical protein M5D96_008855 [Drosophila gunungcola]|uniref:Uncharacterized protein n=1 Tax=Drosophila gunungcola TaxID=103775 RepID=A0A9Q0BNB6_9MUSC|nr:hypothetical protein M5D96_008855 [Drosophila gunungcola]